jgi:cytosine/adenosine deaminase-related metal-dependent hydrolase
VSLPRRSSAPKNTRRRCSSRTQTSTSAAGLTRSSSSLLAKAKAKAEAEGVTPPEAQALTAKAAELMARYGIDRALLAAARPETVARRSAVNEAKARVSMASGAFALAARQSGDQAPDWRERLARWADAEGLMRW